MHQSFSHIVSRLTQPRAIHLAINIRPCCSYCNHDMGTSQMYCWMDSMGYDTSKTMCKLV